MDGMLPEEPGQPALSPCDVEPTSETVRTSDAPVSSRLRSARCGSIASETNLLDHMSAQVADGGTCQSTSFALASSGPAPVGPRMLYRQDDGQSRTDYQEQSQVLTLDHQRPEVLTYESRLRNAILEHLIKNQLIRESQHGFLTGQSCLNNLLEFLDKVMITLIKELMWMLFFWIWRRPLTKFYM